MALSCGPWPLIDECPESPFAIRMMRLDKRVGVQLGGRVAMISLHSEQRVSDFIGADCSEQGTVAAKWSPWHDVIWLRARKISYAELRLGRRKTRRSSSKWRERLKRAERGSTY